MKPIRLPATALAAIASCVVAAPVPVLAQCQYEITDMLITPPPNTIVGRAMNDHGAVVGYRNSLGGLQHAVYWSPDTGVVTLTLPGAFNSRATDINNAGDIVGWQDTKENGDIIGKRAFVIENGVYTRIDPLPGGNRTEAAAINDAGVVVGTWGNIATGPLLAFRWHEGQLVDLGPTIGGETSSAFDVNLDGVTTGWFWNAPASQWFGFDLSGTLSEDLLPLSGGAGSRGDTIDSQGVISGSSTFFLKDGTGYLRATQWALALPTDLGVLPNLLFSRASDMNDAGQVVGYCNNQFLADITPFLWQNGVMYNLRDLLVAGDLELEIPYAILNDGRILCTANTNGAGGSVILTPVNSRAADVNNDCIVDRTDLILLLEQWGTTQSFADVDGDGIVNVFDLLDLLQQWG